MKRNKILILFIFFLLIVSAVFIIKLIIGNKFKRRPPNIILIVVDALRPDHLGCYGYKRNTSPNIDRLAKEGAMFTQAISAGGWTIESVPSILTGTYSFTYQIRSWHDQRNQAIKTLPQNLADRGYQSVAWSNHDAFKNLDIKYGFDKFYLQKTDTGGSYVNDYTLTSQIIDRLKKRYKTTSFFFYIHYYGCHAPYRPPAPYKQMYLNDRYRQRPGKYLPISKDNVGDGKYDGKDKIPYIVAENNISDPGYYISLYDGVISYTDAQIGRLLDYLKESGLYDNMMIILTADHGEMLGEQGIYFNHYLLYEENIRVPLIIKLPGSLNARKAITGQVSLADITPTIYDKLKIKQPSCAQGESLLKLLDSKGNYKNKYLFSCDRRHLSVRGEGWKLIYDDKIQSWQLYNLIDDPQERNNLTEENPAKLKQLKKIINDCRDKADFASFPSTKAPALSREDQERLRALGYVE